MFLRFIPADTILSQKTKKKKPQHGVQNNKNKIKKFKKNNIQLYLIIYIIFYNIILYLYNYIYCAITCKMITLSQFSIKDFLTPHKN